VTDLVGAVAQAMHVPSLAGAVNAAVTATASASTTAPQTLPVPFNSTAASAGDVQAAGPLLCDLFTAVSEAGTAARGLNDSVDWSAQAAATHAAGAASLTAPPVRPAARRESSSSLRSQYNEVIAPDRWLRGIGIAVAATGWACLVAAVTWVVWSVIESHRPGAPAPWAAALPALRAAGPLALCGLWSLALAAGLRMLASLGVALRDSARHGLRH
jgi:hypothetical protein